jgi:copper resistance protein C
MKSLISTVAILGSLAVAPQVLAHAMLHHAIPAVGSTVRAAPSKVELWFSENLEPAFSTIKVIDSTGKQVDKRDKAIDDRDKAHLVVSLPPLPPGTYRVVWRALSADTHVTEGDFIFRLEP